MVTRDDILRAAELIRRGKLVAFPTETVYGLGANALDAEAVSRIFTAKGRPATSPLIVHVASAEMARQIAAAWPEQAAALAARFWPGPLTIVLPKRPEVPDVVTAGLPTAGIRMPAHPVALALIEAAGVPVAAPSANRFTQLSPTTAGHVSEGLADLVLDGGPTDIGIESTVVSLAGGQPVLLRPGMVTASQLEPYLGPLGAVTSAEGAHPAPGLHAKHYSPSTALYVTHQLPPGRGAWVWWNRDQAAARSVRLSSDAGGYARQLYATLHELDTQELDFIAVEPVPDGPEWAGVRDRLRRAGRDWKPEIA
jgi:L-threonylcarbamoyladenylate synthase